MNLTKEMPVVDYPRTYAEAMACFIVGRDMCPVDRNNMFANYLEHRFFSEKELLVIQTLLDQVDTIFFEFPNNKARYYAQTAAVLGLGANEIEEMVEKIKYRLVYDPEAIRRAYYITFGGEYLSYLPRKYWPNQYC